MSNEEKKFMRIVPPYVTRAANITSECNLSKVDSVERGGYVSPDKKIQSFIESGTLSQNYQADSSYFDIKGEETENDPDSPEYQNELTNEAENFDGEILPQFIDNISAMEILDNITKKCDSDFVSNAEKKENEAKKQKEESKFLGKLSDSVADAIIKSSKKENVEA